EALFLDAHHVGEKDGGDGQGRSGHDVRRRRHEAGDEPGEVHEQDKHEQAADDPQVLAPVLAHRAFEQPVEKLDKHLEENVCTARNIVKPVTGEQHNGGDQDDHDDAGVDDGGGDGDRPDVEHVKADQVVHEFVQLLDDAVQAPLTPCAAGRP